MFHVGTAFLLISLVFALCPTAIVHDAQASTECVAPAMSPRTVTPDTMASHVEATAEEADPTPIPEGVPADQETFERFVAAEESMFACLNSGDYVTAVEQLITDEIDHTTACPDSYGQQHLRPGQEEADMILMGLQPGASFLVCDVATPAGHAHQALGMVAQATVD